MNVRRQDSRPLLHSYLATGARLNGSLSAVASHLNGIASLRLMGHGSVLRYEVVQKPALTNAHILELTKDRISLEYISDSISISESRNALSMFLSILALLSAYYEPRLSDLYPAIMAALKAPAVPIQGGTGDTSLNSLSARVRSLSELNYLMSERIISYSQELMRLSDQLSTLREFGSSIFQVLSARNLQRAGRVSSLVSLGIPQDTVQSAADLLL